MRSTEYDLVVIGGGPAGERGAAQAAYFGKRVAIVDRGREPGGAAVHTGTLPSKTLREAGLFLSGYHQRDLYGVTIGVDDALTVRRLLDRTDAVIGLETDRIHRNLDRHRIELVPGTARVASPTLVEVATPDRTRRLATEHILLATGSSSHHPAGIPFEDPDVVDAEGILRIDHLPSSLAVIGAGVIGCEYACMFAALGTEVHLIDPRPGLLPFLDAEMGSMLQAAMIELGIKVHLERRHDRVERDADGLTTTLSDGESFTTHSVLVAAGRAGNTAGLGLEDLGVDVDARGYVVVDRDFRTSVPTIWAAGDVIGFPALASVSMEQGRVAVCHAFGFAYKQEVSALQPYGIYTIPEVSSVGLGEEAAAQRGIDAVVGRASFRDNVRAQIMGDREGMVKLVFERATRKLIGCHCIGERASDLVHIGQVAIALGGTAETFVDMVFNHPTLGETFKYAAYDALGTLGPAEP